METVAKYNGSKRIRNRRNLGWIMAYGFEHSSILFQYNFKSERIIFNDTKLEGIWDGSTMKIAYTVVLFQSRSIVVMLLILI